jgi:hypothetical protein
MLGIEERIKQEISELETLIENRIENIDLSDELDTAVSDAMENFDWSEVENNIDWSSVCYNNDIASKDDIAEGLEELKEEFEELKQNKEIDYTDTQFENLVNRAVENYLKDVTFTLSFNKSDNK